MNLEIGDYIVNQYFPDQKHDPLKCMFYKSKILGFENARIVIKDLSVLFGNDGSLAEETRIDQNLVIKKVKGNYTKAEFAEDYPEYFI